MDCKIPKVLHLFGLTGVGKTYTAQVLAAEFGYFVYDADQDFTPRMREATRRGETFSDDMRDEFYRRVAERAEEIHTHQELLIIPQATYRERHRRYLKESVTNLAQIWVVANDSLVDKRIIERGGEVTLEYSRRVRAFFEAPPTHTPKLINNSGPDEIVGQFRELCAQGILI